MSEVKKSVVANTHYKKELELSHGVFYIHGVEFENGDGGEYMSKSKDQDKFVKGQEIEYTIQSTQYGNKIKPYTSKPFTGGGGGKSTKGGNISAFALSYAKDWTISQLEAGREVDTKAMLAVADRFLEWLKNNQ